MSEEVTIHVVLNNDEACALAQFFKRVCLSDFQLRAINDDEAYQMQYASSKIQSALADKGFCPR